LGAGVHCFCFPAIFPLAGTNEAKDNGARSEHSGVYDRDTIQGVNHERRGSDCINLTILRALVTIAGLVFCVLGYKLFVKGVYEKGGDLNAVWGDKNLALKQAGPGTFFALFGLLVVGIGIWRDTGLAVGLSIPADSESAKPRMLPGGEIPPLDQLIEENEINVQKLGKFGYSMLWSIYLNAKRSGMTPQEINLLFATAVKTSSKADEGVEGLNALVTARNEIFLKNVGSDHPQPTQLAAPAPRTFSKPGLGIDF